VNPPKRSLSGGVRAERALCFVARISRMARRFFVQRDSGFQIAAAKRPAGG